MDFNIPKLEKSVIKYFNKVFSSTNKFRINYKIKFSVLQHIIIVYINYFCKLIGLKETMCFNKYSNVKVTDKLR